jgi:2-aminoethylphosphonate-pyruvate transaminase
MVIKNKPTKKERRCQMINNEIPDNPYLLLTPGPLSTSKAVRKAMLQDWCTWDDDYNVQIVQNIRRRLVKMATKDIDKYTAILMQGSGSFAVEACLGTAVSNDGKALFITNGAYGRRMIQMSERLKIDYVKLEYEETKTPGLDEIEQLLQSEGRITHVAFVHCETTTGILNPLQELAILVKRYDKVLIVDAMSSFGGIPMDISHLGIDFLISSANKCIQGVPGFAFVIAIKDQLLKCRGNARSLVLDLFDQWEQMDQSGKWRYTSPTHVVRAFYQALTELEHEGGIEARLQRYQENHRLLVEGMRSLGFQTLLSDEVQSPIITSFLYPERDFNFPDFYQQAKQRGFVLYPGKISKADTFRIGNIGDICPDDIKRLIAVLSDFITLKKEEKPIAQEEVS